jgi:hypothetical protein
VALRTELGDLVDAGDRCDHRFALRGSRNQITRRDVERHSSQQARARR